MLTLTGDEIEDLIRRAIAHGPPQWGDHDGAIKRLDVIGSLFHNVPSLEARALYVAASRIGSDIVQLGWEDAQSLSTESIKRESIMFSKAVDVLVTGFIDNDTFGAGRRIMEQLGQTLEMGASLGADIRVISPREFPLLKRVLRETSDRAKKTGATFEEHHDFESFEDIDAVYAMNWCRLDDFNRPERNAEHASKYRDWHFTHKVLPPDSQFITNPPVQTELLASRDVIDGENNLTPYLFAWIVQALLASISYVSDEKGKHPKLI
jgi:ornithine carbamoyltransferase